MSSSPSSSSSNKRSTSCLRNINIINMAITGLFHHFGTFLLFAAAILLLITTISAPVINDISMLKVTLTNFTDLRNSSVTFGTFGHCVLDVAPVKYVTIQPSFLMTSATITILTSSSTDQDYCSGRSIGYSPAHIMASIDGTDFSTAGSNTADGLTRVMILHPICCGLAFIAFLLALGAGLIGGLLASIVSAITWILTLVVMATDFTAFGIIKNNVNKDGTGSHAKFGVGMWTVLAAMILLFFATFLVFFTCLSKRKHRHDTKVTKHEAGYANGTTTTKRRFWQRRSRY